MKTTSRPVILILTITCIATMLAACATKKTTSTPLGSGSGQSLRLGTGSDSTGQNFGLLDPDATRKSDSTGAVEVEVLPVRLYSPPITYPELARKAGIEGSVWVTVLVGIDGVARATLIEKDSGTLVGFEDSARACAKASRWKPAENKGRPVALWVTYEIKFQLDDPQ